MFKTGLEIARECKIEHIRGIATRIGMDEEDLEYYGNYKAKVSLDLPHRNEDKEDGKSILMATINPTKVGGGKSTTTVDLGDALNRVGKETMIALHEPSLDPAFGLKGRVAGGSYTQVIPVEGISLHLTGGVHAITTANSLISACLDDHIHQGNELDIDIENITWKRCLDINDHTLRHITIEQGPKTNGVERVDGFSITVANEVMAVLCLSASSMGLKERLGNVLVTFNSKKEPIYIRDLGIEGVLTIVMRDAIRPNMVQTLEHNPVLIHGGPFANIAHGCNSTLATRTYLGLTDYTVTEAGSGADFGVEKFLDTKYRFGGPKPNAVVIVATIRTLKQHGNVAYEDLKDENVEAILTGCRDLAEHIDTVKQFGLPYIVAISESANDTPAKMEALQSRCKEYQHPMSLSQVWTKGGEGVLDLADQLVELYAEENSYALLYDVEQGIEKKITAITTRVYGAEEVASTKEAKERIASYTSLGRDKIPVYMAKTQMSLPDSAKVYEAPENFTITVRELRPSPGAGLLIALTEKILTMPGLPKMPATDSIGIGGKGYIEGLS